jgi:hypothetical protein
MILNGNSTNKESFNSSLISTNNDATSAVVDENKVAQVNTLSQSIISDLSYVQRLLDYFFKVQELTENFGGQ